MFLSSKKINSSEDFSVHLRGLSLQMVNAANSSHIGGVLSMADLISVLYHSVLNIDKINYEHPDRDRFILSKGHCCAGIYAALMIKGILSLEQLKTYGKNDSILMAHISHKVPGVEFSTGALGHGLPFGVGKALFGKMHKFDWKTFVMLSDGEMDEGSNWEALLFASHHKLENLTCIVDFNNLQSLDTIEKTLNLEPLDKKLESFGFDVIQIDGHDHNQILQAFNKKSVGKPKIIIAKTVKGKGVDYMENEVLWHYRPPNDEELQNALKQIGY